MEATLLFGAGAFFFFFFDFEYFEVVSCRLNSLNDV